MADEQKTVVHFAVADHAAEYPLHGVYGGVTPQGNISASFFSERVAIPKEVDITIPVDADGNVMLPIEGERRGKSGIIRIVSGTYYMTADMAEAVGKWLLEKAAERRAFDAD